MKVILLLLFAATCHASHNLKEWEMFKKTHGKTYENADEEQQRKEIFLRNVRMINDHNENYRKGLTTFHMKINHFADMTEDELKSTKGRPRIVSQKRRVGPMFVPRYSMIPDHIDWRAKGAVTPVKNQGNCGSCWAFTATGALEGQHFIKTGKLVSLSEQNLIDCSWSHGNHGCSYGIATQAFDYVKANGGLDSEESYPYEAKSGSCRFKSYTVSAVDKGYALIPGGENSLKEAVATIGPIAVEVDSSLHAFRYYSGGIFYSKDCSSTRLDHGMLVVGYGSENGQDYWILKNSWSSRWGEGGYIRIARNRGNNCGVATTGCYPTL